VSKKTTCVSAAYFRAGTGCSRVETAYSRAGTGHSRAEIVSALPETVSARVDPAYFRAGIADTH
jgi:hypothetical protein